MKKLSILVLIFLLFSINQLFAQKSTNDFGSVIFYLKYSAFNSTGFGGKIKIVNVSDNTEHTGQSKNGFSPYVKLPNLPLGVYKILELSIKTGSGTFVIYDVSKFSNIEVKENTNYYLGTYISKKTGLLKLEYEIVLDKDDDFEKIKKQFSLINNTGEKNIDFSKKLFASDTTNFEIKF
jgi:hypothetical protein